MSAHKRWFSSDVIAGALFLVALAGGAFLMFGGSGSGGDPTGTVGDGANKSAVLALGKKLYAQHCASCHGANLEGEKNWRSRNADGTLKAPPHDATGHTWHHSDDLLFRYTKDGGAKIAGGAFKSAMPGFGAALKDNEIWAILAYIKSRWPQDIRDRQAKISKSRQ